MSTAAEIAAARADLEHRAAGWTNSLPPAAQLTPAVGVSLADAALADSKSAVAFVVSSFTGTAPPPPWPAGPELVKAIDRVKAHRDGMAVVVKRAPKATLKDPAKVRAALARDGADLYRQSGELLTKLANAPKLPDGLPDARALLSDLIFGLPVLVVVVGLWFLVDGGRERHRLFA